MPRLDHDAHAPRLESAAERLGDLLGHPLLELESVREHGHQAGNLAQPDDAALGQIADVDGSKKGQHVVLTQRVERNVLDQDHLVVVLLEHGSCDHL